MKNWILNIISVCHDLQTCDETFNALRSTVMLLFVLWNTELIKDGILEVKHYQMLFKGLCLPSNFETDRWICFVNSFSNHNKLIVEILKYVHDRSSKCRQAIPEVIFSFPLHHFAQGLCVPFQHISKVLFLKQLAYHVSYFTGITAKRYDYIINSHLCIHICN